MGTRTESTIMRVIDGDTLLVKIGDRTETLRLIGCDTEESHSKLKSKPNTNAGVLAAEFGKQYWWNAQPVIEFESDFPLEKCLETERDWYNRLKCYVFKDDENYNLRLVQEGLSPYFRKYGSSQFYHERFEYAMVAAQDSRAGIWNPNIDADSAGRNYVQLMPWWNLRGNIADHYSVYGAKTAHDASGICDNLCRLIRETQAAQKKIEIFCDLQGGATGKFKKGYYYKVGTKKSSINLWIEQKELIDLIESQYTYTGKGYAYVSGVPQVRFGVVQLQVLEVCDRPSQFTNVGPESLPSNAHKEKVLECVRYAARRVIKNASNL